FFSSRRRHTRFSRDWSSDVCSSDLMPFVAESIWQALAEAAFERGLPSPDPATESIVIAPWPQFPVSWKDPAMEQRIARMQEVVRSEERRVGKEGRSGCVGYGVDYTR